MKVKLISTNDKFNLKIDEHREVSNVLNVWKNDYGLFRLVIAPDSNSSVNISIDTFKSADNNLLESINEIFIEKRVDAFIGHAGWYARNKKCIMPKGEKRKAGEILEKIDNKSNIKVLEPTCIWFKINVSSLSKATLFNSKIKIKTNIDEIIIPISLNVLNREFISPNQYLFRPEYWQHPYNVAEYYQVEPFSDKHIKILKKLQKFYKYLGGNSFTCTIVEEPWGGQTYSENEIHYPSMIKWKKDKKGNISYDYTHFDKWVNLNLELGIDKRICCYSVMPWQSIVRFYDVKDRVKKSFVNPLIWGKYKKVWSGFLNDFIKHLDSKNWFDLIYMSFDERHNIDKVIKFLMTFKNKEGNQFKLSSAFNNFKNSEVFNKLDYASVGLDIAMDNIDEFKDIVDKRNNEGKETTIYTATEHFPNSVTHSVPGESYWTMMLALKFKTTGFLRWAFDAWTKTPLIDTTHYSFPAGDCYLVFPDNKNTSRYDLKWSIRLLKLDEGLRDINKIYYLLSEKIINEEDIAQISSSIKMDYKYYELKDKKWESFCRTAKWATSETAELISKDMDEFKQNILNL